MFSYSRRTLDMKELEKLKQYVLTSQDLSEPFNYLFDLVKDNILMSYHNHRIIEKINNPDLFLIMNVLKQEISNRLGICVQEFLPMFCEIPEYHFIHGDCSPKGYMLPVPTIYFSDVKTGLFAFHGKETTFLRFSLTETPYKSKIH